MAYTTRSTVNRLACEELHIRILWYQNDQRRNLYIELQKGPEAQSESCKKQRIFLNKPIAFSKLSFGAGFGVSEEKRARVNMIPVIRIYRHVLYLQRVLITAEHGLTI